MSQLRRQTLLVGYRAFSELVGKGAFFLVTLVAARRLTQEAFGVFSLGTTVGWVAAVAADFGIQLHFARSVAQRPTDATRLLRGWLRVRMMTAAVAILSVGIGLRLASSSPTLSRAVFLFTIVYAISGLVEFLHYFYRGLSRSDVESTLTLWQRIGTLLLAALALWWRADVTWLAVAMLLPVVATFVYSVRQAQHLARSVAQVKPVNAVERLEHVEPVEPFEPVTPLATFSAVTTIGAGILLSALYFRIDVFLIQMWQGTTSVALYNAVFRLVEALRLFPAAVLAVALPVLFRATSRGPLVKLSSLLAIGAASASVVLWIAAGWLIPALFGGDYAPAVFTFRVLLLSFPLMSVNYALTHQVIGWRGHRAYAIMAAAALVFNVALNTQLIRTLGIVGAAWSTLATEALITIACLVALAKLASPLAANLSGPSNLANLSNSSNVSNQSNVSNSSSFADASTLANLSNPSNPPNPSNLSNHSNHSNLVDPQVTA